MLRGSERMRRYMREGAAFGRWVLYAAFLGVAVGLVGVAFLLGIDWATGLRGRYPQLILMLPLVGVSTVLMYRIFGMERDRGTNLVLVAVRS